MGKKYRPLHSPLGGGTNPISRNSINISSRSNKPFIPSQVKYPSFLRSSDVISVPVFLSQGRPLLWFLIVSLVNSFCFFVEDFPLKFSFNFFSHFIHLSEESFLAFSIPMPVTLWFFSVNSRFILCLLSSSLLTNEHFYYRSSIHIWIHFRILQVLWRLSLYRWSQLKLKPRY